MTDKILYQSIAQPVPEDPSNNMAKWWSPASEPQMNQLKKYAIILAAASGMVLNPEPIPNPAPDIISVQISDQFRKISTQTAPWQRATEFDPLPIPTPPNVAMWQPWTNIPVRLPVGLTAPWQTAEFFVDIQPFILASDGDVYVKQIQDNQWIDEKLLDEKRRQEWERFREEMRFNRERRADIEKAFEEPPIDFKPPAIKPLYRAPNTLPLASDMVRAQQLAQQIMLAKQAEEEEKQLERLLLDL